MFHFSPRIFIIVTIFVIVKYLVTFSVTIFSEDKNMNLFVQRLNELIENSGKQQKEICKALGIYKQKFSRWKLGETKPNYDELIMLAKYFNVTTDYLLGLED